MTSTTTAMNYNQGNAREQSLNQEQRDILSIYGEKFKNWIDTDDGKNTVNEHREHQQYFREKLSSENLSKMTEQEFTDLYKKLWASNMWGNKDWYVEHKLINPNGLEKIKNELTKFLYGSEDFIFRYNNFKNNISGFGVSSISEILHFLFSDQYCLWNDKPKTVLPFLELDILPERFFKYQIGTGEEYYKCIQALRTIKDEIARFGIKDFIDLDIFFLHIHKDIVPCESRLAEPLEEKESLAKLSRIIIDSHESAEYYLLEVGRMLGYVTYTVDQSKKFNGKNLGNVALLNLIPAFAGERDLNSAREIDVIWFGDDENPKLCFEIEHSTDIVHGLNRLAQLQHLYVNFFIVATEDKRAKFDIEMRKYPFRRMKDRFGFISYDELAALSETSIPFYDLRTRLLREKEFLV